MEEAFRTFSPKNARIKSDYKFQKIIGVECDLIVWGMSWVSFYSPILHR